MTDTDGENWPAFEKWHLLFDELCNRSGHYDNAGLASRYCTRLGKRGEGHFDTAVRNLRNWRSGRHIPRQRNFMVLSQVLEVAKDPDLLARWNELYAQVREAEGETDAVAVFEVGIEQPDTRTGPGAVSVDAAAVSGHKLPRVEMKTALVGLVFFCGGVLASEVYRAEPWLSLWPEPKAPLIVLRPHVSLQVGESIVIHGERGDCGKPPPDWEYVLTRLPISRIGSFSDGGVVRRNSNFCRGETPARAVTFTASRSGVEELLVLGDVMRVTVDEPSL
jgi:hypothetical protein